MIERPRCARCGYLVTVASDGGGQYSAWCYCAQTSSADRHHRGVGLGADELAAVQAWLNWTPETERK